MPETPLLRPDATQALVDALQARILVLDGAMGTMIQRHTFSEAEYRGERFADWDRDLRGNNDLLTLTQPEAISGIHRAYLEAGSDLVETNTFNAQTISLADYGMEELAYELNLESARLARAECDAMTAADPDRPAVRGRRARPDQPHRLDLARRQRPGRAQRHLHGARRGLPRAGQRPGRRRRRPPAHRDDLRHAQRQGGDLRARDAVRGARPPVAGDDLRDDHRRVRAHAVGPGHRGVLELGAPRQAAARRAQLRARRAGDAALPGRDLARGRLLRLVLPERRSAQRLRRVRRGARPDGRRSCASSPRAAWSTCSAAAAAPRRSTSPPWPRSSTASPRACRPSGPRPAGCPASSRSRSRPTRCSSTSASAPTSPARRSSAT